MHIEQHPLGFFLPPSARLLILGSFPPVRKRWSMNFYYPNFQNDMWRIMGLIFFADRHHFIHSDKKGFNEEKIRTFCTERGIALGDTAEEVHRRKANASDQFLEVIKPWDPSVVLPQIPDCRGICLTGQKAMDTFTNTLPVQSPGVGQYSDFTYRNRLIRLYRMPSSSRAYPRPLEQKAELYKTMFHDLNMI